MLLGDVSQQSCDCPNVFGLIFEQSGISMANLDLDLRVLTANKYFSQQFGWSRQDVVGQDFRDLLHPGMLSRIEPQFTSLALGERPRFVEQMVAVRARQRMFVGELTGIAVADGVGLAGSIMVLVKPDKAEQEPRSAGQNKKLLNPLHARILEGVAKGDSTVQLAEKLLLSSSAVEYYVATLMRKLKVPNRPALVSKSYSTGILGIGQWPPKVTTEFVK